ncbi:MAG: NINE protein [Ruminococcus sp.]|nr:NINE protein [Ruminococcus sp.]
MEKSKTTTLILCVALGYLGVHRFYTGKIKSGVLYLLTGGLCGVGWIVDLVLICTDKFNRVVTAPSQTSQIKARSKALGVGWYTWQTSQDERVRPSHKNMQGVLVNWNDPPSPEALIGEKSCGKYHAGDGNGCRCYPEPVVELKYLRFPVKVYHKGKIKKMTREEFNKIANK